MKWVCCRFSSRGGAHLFTTGGKMRDWDFVSWILFIIFGAFAIFVLNFLIVRYRWSEQPVFKQKCILTSLKYEESTQQTNTFPVINSNGSVGVGLSTTGNPESYVTIWNCGEYGRLKTDSRTVFQWSKIESIL